jgi:hypothetical protein
MAIDPASLDYNGGRSVLGADRDGEGRTPAGAYPPAAAVKRRPGGRARAPRR